MSSSSSSPTPTPLPVPPELVPGGRVRDLRACVAEAVTDASGAELDEAADHVLGGMLDEIVLGMCFDIHRAVKTGVYSLTEVPEHKSSPSGPSSSSGGGATDVFGQAITTAVGVPTLKKQPECVCPNCQRNMAATRFAPHLEKCMGMGRNSSRLASRRLATNSKDPCYRESGGQDDDDDAEDEDWLEPSAHGHLHGHHPRGGAGSGHYGQGGNGGGRRRRDKNSPRRNRGMRGAKSSGHSGDSTPQEGTITPPTSFDQLTLEERSQWLSAVCGVMGLNSRKICSRSTRCPVHTDAQRREVRIRWLSAMVATDPTSAATEEGHVDIDGFTEGDTAALRESLAQLSNASSPAESVISTSSNPGANTRSHGGGGGRREKGGGGRRGKKNKPGSKSGSRGSTPPLMHID